MADFYTPTVTLYDLIQRLGIEERKGWTQCINPNCQSREDSKKRKLHLSFDKDCWNCVVCGSSGGVLRFYTGYVKGELELPRDKKDLGKLSGELLEFMGMNSNVQQAAPAPAKPKKTRVPVASDDVLDLVYSKMMQIPDLQLSAQHRNLLKKRGLTDEEIDRNGYRSIPDKWTVPNTYERMYQDAGGSERARNIFEWLAPSRIKFGLMVAHCLVSMGLELRGIPGFYRFGDFWCFWAVPGILIPTRNINGQIVIWQVRKEKVQPGKAKYITVSSQDLPGHVTEEVSRCHFPIASAPLDSSAPVLVTEGPLKADIACSLFGSPAIFAAIPGVTTTNDLLRHCEVFKKSNISCVLNALDMDKLTNKNVRNGVIELRKKFESQGIMFRDYYWATSYANFKFLSLDTVAKCRNIPVRYPPAATVFERLNIVASALDDAHIETCKIIGPDGKEDTCHWEPTTKGIDDYLFSLRKAKR